MRVKGGGKQGNGGQGKWVRRGEALEEHARVRVERLKSPSSDGERHCCVEMPELCDGLMVEQTLRWCIKVQVARVARVSWLQTLPRSV